MTRGVQFKRRMQRLLIHLILIIFSIIMIVPFVWMTLTAFKTVNRGNFGKSIRNIPITVAYRRVHYCLE